MITAMTMAWGSPQKTPHPGSQCKLYTQGIFSEFAQEITQMLLQLSNNEEYISYT